MEEKKKRRGNPNWNPSWKKKEPIVKVGYKPIATPSEAQKNIWSFVKNEKGNAFVDAKAGAAKTSSLIEAMWQLPSSLELAYFVFGNRNAREAEPKVPDHCIVQTCHSLGLRAIKSSFGKIEVDAKGEKANAIAMALVGAEDEKTELRLNLIKAMSLAKGYLAADTYKVLDIVDKHGVELCDEDPLVFATNVLKGLEFAVQQYTRVDFDDMLYLPYRKNLRTPQFDIVFVDEEQDLNDARLDLVFRAVKPHGRIIACGDRNQAIFGFSGANEQAVDAFIERATACVLPLNTTYRCGKQIVELAKQYVPDYAAGENNPEGEVLEKDKQYVFDNAKPGDVIISRVNAPLVSLALQFLKQRKKANILGKDLGKNLLWMLKRSKAETVEQFLSWLESWKDLECERLTKRKKDCSHITDKYEVLLNFCEGETALDIVKQHISDMFSDFESNQNNFILLSNGHICKGLEWDRVFLMKDTFKPDKGQEEKNLFYVAITRAKNTLVLVPGK